ncbi:stage III sporulation protein AC/AD protein family protein [Clostridium tepidiprofundi DSM 19306]|uniref:Stage III sporulation protein AC/AD protein family protein n=1 Tax=Clostridium tepidiprofundi DSM 19306 TaxID=1121338 RepID=A0A151B6X7_9CLOT|nr:stage III sporulation protein AD [Clostridium tepidiprofundi]KYH35688.1 stage III sporulation protein AC/AD protein family protein [Clostridium tepidiprofundi DSM 19306]
MEIIKITLFAFTALFIILIFKGRRDDIAVLISLFSGVILIMFILPKIAMILNFIKLLANKANIDFGYLNIIFKILGIAYLGTFSAAICKDAGESMLASKVEIVTKILILAMSVPILMAVLNSILKII